MRKRENCNLACSRIILPFLFWSTTISMSKIDDFHFVDKGTPFQPLIPGFGWLCRPANILSPQFLSLRFFLFCFVCYLFSKEQLLHAFIFSFSFSITFIHCCCFMFTYYRLPILKLGASCALIILIFFHQFGHVRSESDFFIFVC